MSLIFRMLRSIPLLLAGLIMFSSNTQAEAGAKGIKLGAIFSLSGFGELGGRSELNGLELALDEINQQGGIAGKQVELIVEDSRSDLKTTATAYQKLATVDRVRAVIGPNWAEFAEVAAAIAERTKVPMITSTGYSKTLTKDRSFVFTLLENHRTIIHQLAEEIAKQKPKDAVLLVAESTYFRSLADSLIEDLKSLGVENVRTIDFHTTDSDFRTSIAQLNKDKVDVVVSLLSEGPSQLSFFRQSSELKLSAARFSSNAILFDDGIKKNMAVAEGVIFFDYELPGLGEFKARYLLRFGAPFLPYAAKSYDAAYLIKQAIEKCGEDANAIVGCLEKADLLGVSGRIQFNARHEIVAYRPVARLYSIRSGMIVPYPA